MSMTDPVADMLTRIRNGMSVDKRFVDIPSSNLKKRIAFVLKQENYIEDFMFVENKDNVKSLIRIFLKYDNRGKAVITGIERVSKPGRRIYVGGDQIPRVLDGLGIAILSTSKGVISNNLFNKYLAELNLIPQKIEKSLSINNKIEEIAEQIKDSTNCLYLGRGFNFPVALEGALKLKEISYIHAEGYPAAEMKHGPIALIDENMPTVVIATAKGHYEKVVSNIREIQSRKGKIIAIITEGDKDVKEIADYYIEIPETIESLTPLLTTIPLQLLSYHIAVKLGKNVDQPRNLAKSVTVE